MAIVCRVSTLVRIVAGALLLGVLAGLLAVRADPGGPAAPAPPAPQTTRHSWVQPDQHGEEVRTWRPTRS